MQAFAQSAGGGKTPPGVRVAGMYGTIDLF
jgi:hypothetical protein